MEKIFNLTSTFKTHAEEDGSVLIRGMASTVDFDRAGDSISAEAWQKGGMANFEKNPIILFNHDYDKPIGRATGLKAGPNGLEMEAKISKHAHCAALIKDGVLGAFSVGFRVKDADYVKETDGLMIKDAELFEVSVVSVPCNQSATFSLAKSFDSTEEYEEFKKTFTNRVDLAGQSLAKEEVITSSVASDTPKSAEQSADQEIKMDNTQNIDLEAFAKKVADETAAKIAMKQAEQKAAEQAEAKAQAEIEAARTLEGEKIQATIKSGVETGVEKLMADVKTDMEKQGADTAEVIAKYKADLEEKNAEIAAMQQSKKSFSDRGQSITQKEIYDAHIISQLTRKSIEDTAFGQAILSKDVTFTGAGANTRIDSSVSAQFEEDVRMEQRVAGAFKEIQVETASTVLPVALDPAAAVFRTGGLGADAANGQLGTGGDDYTPSQIVLQTHRLLAGTHIENNTSESTLVNLLPMITSALARAHARAIDTALLIGNASGTISKGIGGDNGADDGGGWATASSAIAVNGAASTNNINGAQLVEFVNPEALLQMRAQMGKYGMDPSKVTFIVPLDVYYNMIDDTGFTDISEVGNDLATKVNGVIGTVFGSPVIATDILAARAGGVKTAALAVATDAFLIPRLKGVSIETDYSVLNQRTDLVAAQSIGFANIYAGSAGNRVAVRLPYANS